MRPGYPSLIPYLILSGGAHKFAAFTQKAFGAALKMIVPGEDGRVRHAELWIGESVIEFADSTEEFPPRLMALHFYVPNVDQIYGQALSAGAESLQPVTDQSYGDREAAVRDPFGVIWYIATHKATGHKPEGLGDVTPYLHADGADRLIAFLETAFAAETVECLRDPDRVAHAKVRIGDSVIEMSDAHGQWKAFPVGIHLYVDSADETYRRAIEAGAAGEFAPETKEYGERMAGVRDPSGNLWLLAEYLGEQQSKHPASA